MESRILGSRILPNSTFQPNSALGRRCRSPGLRLWLTCVDMQTCLPRARTLGHAPSRQVILEEAVARYTAPLIECQLRIAQVSLPLRGGAEAFDQAIPDVVVQKLPTRFL